MINNLIHKAFSRKNFYKVSVFSDLNEILVSLKQERDRIDTAIEAVMALNGESAAAALAAPPARSTAAPLPRRASVASKKRVISPEARARMVAAQKAPRAERLTMAARS